MNGGYELSYCTRTDIEAVIPAKVLASLLDLNRDGTEDPNALDKAIERASAVVDSYTADRYETPFSPVPSEVTTCTVTLVRYALFSARGLDPAKGSDQVIKADYDHAMRWLRDVSAGRARIRVGTDTPHAPEIHVSISSAEARFPRDFR